MEKEQKKKLEEFLRTADELKKWLMDNDLYNDGEIIERKKEDKFKAGEWLWDDTLRIPIHVDEVFDEKYRLTDNTGKIYYKPKAEVEAVCRKYDVLKGAEQPSGNLDGLYLYKHIHNNGITVSLKTSSEGDMMEIVGLSPRQRIVLGAIIECFAKE